MRSSPSSRWRPWRRRREPSVRKLQPACSQRSIQPGSVDAFGAAGAQQPARSGPSGTPSLRRRPIISNSSSCASAGTVSRGSSPLPFASTAASQRSGTADRAGGQLVAVQSQPAMRAGPDADIVAVAPVHEVVTRLLPGPGVVADLVGRQAGTLQHLLGQFVEVGLQIRVERLQRALARPSRGSACPARWSADRATDARWRGRGPGPARPAKPPRSGQGGRRSGRTSAAGRPAPPAPRRARASAVSCSRPRKARSRSFRAWTPKETRFTPAARNPRNRSASTEVGLASSVISMSGAHGPTLGGTVDDGGHGRRLHQRRRAAAEEDRAQGAARRQVREMIQLGHQGPRPARMVDTTADMAVEVAVWAFGPAERPVDVEREAPVR